MTTELGTELAVDVQRVFAQIDGSKRLGDATKTKYKSVVSDFLNPEKNPNGRNLLSAQDLATFADGLSNSRRGHLKAVVKLYTSGLMDDMNALAQPTAENAQDLEARMAQSDRRFKALQNAVQVEQSEGRKAHTWLSKAQVVQLSNAIGNGIHGARDRAAIGLLVGAGLRREEAVNLTFDDILALPVGEKTRYVLAVKGSQGAKGRKNREVPISDTLAADLLTWGEYVGHQGRVIRSLNRRGDIGESLSAPALFKMVQKYGAVIDKPELAPHDLRRTYAQIGYQDGIDIGQISILLGHATIATTQDYLGIKIDHEVTASDFIPW